jgi:DNA primase
MSSFVGERIPLKKAGRNFKGLCPFHNEKTPSFMVSDEKQIFHCFGCGEGGDIFTFVMKYEGLSFAEAVKNLAERCGVEIPKEEMRNAGPDAEAAHRKKLYFRVNELASQWYASNLTNGETGAEARNYLISRGIKSEIWTQLNLGCAEKRWDGLYGYLKSRGVPPKLAEELGLIRKRRSGDGYYDFFRGRLMFPIHSPRGEVIAFSGRVLDDADDVKYMNSPDSTIFHKSMSVYGLNRAAQHIRRDDQVLIVEGQMDVIGLAQAGIGNAVAPLGTALTSGHMRMLGRMTRNMVLLFDGDEAGTRAALRTLPLFIEIGIMPRIVALPAGEDPDSLVHKEGAEAMRERVKKASSLFDFALDDIVSKAGRDAKGKVEAMSRLKPLLKQMKDPVEQGVYSQRVADKLGLAEALVGEAVRGPRANAAGKERRRALGRSLIVPSVERMLMEIVVQQPELAPRALKELAADDLEDGFGQTLFALLDRHYRETGRVNISDVLDELADPEVEQELRSMALSTDKFSMDEAEQVLSDCIGVIKARPIKEHMLELNELIRRAEAEGDETQLFDLLRRKKEMTAQLNNA